METNKNYDSSVTFPLEIENSKLKVRCTEFEGGKNVAFENGFLYLISADNGGSLRIFDCFSNEPVLVSTLANLGNTRQIEVSSEAVEGRIIAGITARECGVYIVDVTVPEKPFICYHYNSIEYGTGITFAKNYMAVGCRSFGVELVDVSTPEKPRHISSVRAGEVQSVVISDNLLYTGSWAERKITIIDISNANNPKIISEVPLEGRADGLYVNDGILYAAFGQHRKPATGRDPKEDGYAKGNGFAIWDIKNPIEPKQLSYTIFPYKYYCCNYDMWDITICGHYAVIAHTFNGVWIYDIKDLKNPVLVDQTAFKNNTPLCDILSWNDRTLNVTPMIFPFDPHTTSYAPVTGIAVGNGKLYISLEHQNLHIAEAEYFSEPAKQTKLNVSEIGENYYDRGLKNDKNIRIAKTDGQAHAVVSHNGYIYVACGNGGIGVYDSNLMHLNQFKIDDIAMDIRQQDGYIFVASGNSGISIYQPEGTDLKEISNLSIDGKFCAQAVPTENGRFLIVHTGDQSFTIVDISDKTSPKISLTEHNNYGLVYHRQITLEGICGKYYGFFWNGNITKWFDLSGSVPVETEYHKDKKSLSFFDGITGLNEPYQALAMANGGYVIADIREDKSFADYEAHRIGDLWLHGKPIVKDNILYISDRINGYVTICDISDINSPKLLFREYFAGYPDIPCPVQDGVIVPLGHQGIAKINF